MPVSTSRKAQPSPPLPELPPRDPPPTGKFPRTPTLVSRFSGSTVAPATTPAAHRRWFSNDEQSLPSLQADRTGFRVPILFAAPPPPVRLRTAALKRPELVTSISEPMPTPRTVEAGYRLAAQAGAEARRARTPSPEPRHALSPDCSGAGSSQARHRLPTHPRPRGLEKLPPRTDSHRACMDGASWQRSFEPVWIDLPAGSSRMDKVLITIDAGGSQHTTCASTLLSAPSRLAAFVQDALRAHEHVDDAIGELIPTLELPPTTADDMLGINKHSLDGPSPTPSAYSPSLMFSPFPFKDALGASRTPSPQPVELEVDAGRLVHAKDGSHISLYKPATTADSPTQTVIAPTVARQPELVATPATPSHPLRHKSVYAPIYEVAAPAETPTTEFDDVGDFWQLVRGQAAVFQVAGSEPPKGTSPLLQPQPAHQHEAVARQPTPSLCSSSGPSLSSASSSPAPRAVPDAAPTRVDALCPRASDNSGLVVRGKLFLDTDGALFAQVLAFLRTRTLDERLPASAPPAYVIEALARLERLGCEAKWLELDALVDACEREKAKLGARLATRGGEARQHAGPVATSHAHSISVDSAWI